MSVDDGIREFWAWWTTARDRVLRAIEVDRKFSNELVDDITTHVEAIGELDWELCAGRTAQHAFCLSPRGDPEARLITELWRHRGPAPDATWEYFAARQARRSAILFDKVKLDPDELRVAFTLDAARERIDATYFHPNFVKLSDKRRGISLFLLLDGAIGEDGVERWLGRIAASVTEPADAVAFGELLAAVTELERTATGDRFALLEGQTESGERVVVTCNTALKRIDHLLATTHVAIDLAILDANPEGLTTSADAEVLNALEDEVTDALGSRAVYFGRETRRGHRVLHWYAPEDSAAQAIIERWAQQHPERRPHVEWIRDPTWQFVKRYV